MIIRHNIAIALVYLECGLFSKPMRFFIFAGIFFSLLSASYQVSGNLILHDGQPVVLRGVALENGLFSQWNEKRQAMDMVVDGSQVDWALTKADLVEIKNMGATVVRYCLNYEQFAPDNPKRAENFARLEKHLSWCDELDLPLIVNLHIPPGHTNVIRDTEDSIFEDRLVWRSFENFWMDFIKRYKDRACIVGWEFFNEPQIPQNMSKEIWHMDVQRFLKKMRGLDPDKPFFICHPHARVIGRDQHGNHRVNWDFIPLEKYEDPNLVYVGHFYEPMKFTHQGFNEWLLPGVHYPAKSFSYRKYLSSNDAAYIQDDDTRGWHHYQTKPVIPPPNTDYGTPYCAADQSGGTIYFDALKIWEYLPDGTRREIALPNPSFAPDWPAYPTPDGKQLFVVDRYLYWTTYYDDKYSANPDPELKPQYQYRTDFGFDDSFSLSLNNPAQKIANWQTDPMQFCIKPKPDCRYAIEGWAKSALPESAHIGLSWYRGIPENYDQAYLNQIMIERYVQFARDNHVPVMITEWGSVGVAREIDRARWTKDMLVILKKNGLHHTYWCWSQKHGWGIDFGLILKASEDPTQTYYRYRRLLKVMVQFGI